MEYVDRFLNVVEEAYRRVLDYVDNFLEGGLDFFYATSIDGLSVRENNSGLENVVFMGSKKVSGHKAHQVENWVDRRSGAKVSFSGSKMTRKQRKQMRRVHKNKYEKHSRVDEVLAEQERQLRAAAERAEREREFRTSYRPWQ